MTAGDEIFIKLSSSVALYIGCEFPDHGFVSAFYAVGVDLGACHHEDYRIKSMDSIELKYQRYYPNCQVRQVFNDIIGFRAFCDNYLDLLSENSEVFRVVDMSSGKANDDGYRGVHLYYQKDNFHYPIEVQFNTLYDRQLNNWLHAFLYKKDYPNEIGQKMRGAYENGQIRNSDEFEEVLKNVLHSS